MDQSSAVAERTSEKVEFGADVFKANAKLYVEHKRVIDAIATGVAKSNSGYDSFDDAIAQVSKVWNALRSQVSGGAGYTPPPADGFGSNNASQIASSLTGDRTSVGDIRKAFANHGK